VPSGDVLPVGVVVPAELVFEGALEDAGADGAFELAPPDGAFELAPPDVQMPNALWQPVPQYSEVVPQ